MGKLYKYQCASFDIMLQFEKQNVLLPLGETGKVYKISLCIISTNACDSTFIYKIQLKINVKACRVFREGDGTPLQYSCLENPMDGGAWQAVVYGVSKSRTRLSDFPFIFHFHALEKEMATHSSVLAWRIPGTGDPGGLPSMGSHRVRHD